MEGDANALSHSHSPFPIPRRPSATLRLLCKSSTVSALTSRPSHPFDLISRETGASISVEEPRPGCDVLFVVVGRGRAGEAIVRVFESTAEEEGAGASCRVMMAKILVGLFMGKKGRNVDRIRKDSGARIRVLHLEAFVPNAVSEEDVVQIQGDHLSIKKALIAVSAFLQGNPQSTIKQSDWKNSKMPTHAISPDAHRERYRDTYLPAAGSSVSDENLHPKRSNANHVLEANKNMHEISYRLLCAKHKVGGVIGHGATIVKALEKETGTYIRCGCIITQSDERIITITGFESQGTRFSPTQNAVIRVFTRIIEVSMEGRAGTDKDGSAIIRLLVTCDQIGCLMDKGGAVMSEIGKVTSTDIMIISGGQVPKCASRNDEVIQVSGKIKNVQDCLFHITGKLRDNMFSSKLPVNVRSGFHSHETLDSPSSKGIDASRPRLYESLAPSSHTDLQSTVMHSLDKLSLHSNGYLSSQQVWEPKIALDAYSLPTFGREGGHTPFRSGAELGRGSNAVVVKNSTVEIVVPDHAISMVYGNNGANLNSIRQISGARVTVSDPFPGTSERMIAISGTPDQTLAAQSLFRAYLLSGNS